MTEARAYEAGFPWLQFSLGLDNLEWVTWAHLGEAFSKCQHLVGTPLRPDLARELSGVFMRRGALSSAAIEGNTLTEAEVEDIIVNHRRLPESRQYLEQEVRNVLAALDGIRAAAAGADPFVLSPRLIRDMHALLMKDLDVDDHVVAGGFRTVGVGVGTYRAPPAEDVAFLVDRLCTWINAIVADARKQTTEDRAFFFWFIAAAVAHLYIAWIHPFGDGNGRTARAVECAILAHSGHVPWLSANLLSDFYNRTRSRYYRVLEATSGQQDPLLFVAYAATGFRDELREQIVEIQKEQRRVAWVNYVHEVFQQEPPTTTAARRRLAVLALPGTGALDRAGIRQLSLELADAYSGTNPRTFRRDMNRLLELGLVEEQPGGLFRARMEIIAAFRPTSSQGAEVPALRGGHLGDD